MNVLIDKVFLIVIISASRTIHEIIIYWSHLAPEARGSDPEEPPQAQGQGRWPGGATRGVVAAQAQEGLEEPSHIEGQKGQW